MTARGCGPGGGGSRAATPTRVPADFVTGLLCGIADTWQETGADAWRTYWAWGPDADDRQEHEPGRRGGHRPADRPVPLTTRTRRADGMFAPERTQVKALAT
ncbi:hypothetical protein ACIRYZ_46045 [Kitasatospora sp. NPDC101155]|uniref:hypothetical protein n=1 Tax=Kitasatospora sp. NPDC101155 TaxID=3364097 RepID=UPI003819940C